MSKNFELLQKVGKHPAEPLATPRVHRAVTGEVQRELDPRYELKWRTSADDQVSQLVDQLFFFPRVNARLVVFADLEIPNGATAICARTAEILASRTSERVCVVDANLYSPQMHTYFGRMSPSGPEPAPEEPHDLARMAQQIRNSNLFILSGDSLAEQQLGPGARDQLGGLVLQLRDRFDYVLVEAPPIARFHEGLIFGQMSDGVVLVVEANATRREIAKQTKERLQAADVKLLGTVLNNRTYPIPQKLYARL